MTNQAQNFRVSKDNEQGLGPCYCNVEPSSAWHETQFFSDDTAGIIDVIFRIFAVFFVNLRRADKCKNDDFWFLSLESINRMNLW